MKSFLKSRIPAFAFGIAAIVMISIAPASATTVVRDHRGGSPGGGVVVKDSATKRKPNCQGNVCHIHYKNPACLGPFCL